MTAREPRATAPTAGARTAAQQIVAALALPPSATAAEPIRPLPLTGLRQLCRDTTMLYDAAARTNPEGSRTATSSALSAGSPAANLTSFPWNPGGRLAGPGGTPNPAGT